MCCLTLWSAARHHPARNPRPAPAFQVPVYLSIFFHCLAEGMQWHTPVLQFTAIDARR